MDNVESLVCRMNVTEKMSGPVEGPCSRMLSGSRTGSILLKVGQTEKWPETGLHR